MPNANDLHDAFWRAHDVAYGYSSAADPIEIVNVRLSASAKLHQFEDKPPVTGDPGAPVARDRRNVIFFDPDEPVEARIYDRAEMQPGQTISGPAIIEQMDTTTPIYPGDVAQMTPRRPPDHRN